MTLTESVRVNITLIPFSIETEDHWVVANRNFFPVTLEVYQYAVYYESVLIGEGVELEQPPFPAKSDSLVWTSYFNHRFWLIVLLVCLPQGHDDKYFGASATVDD